MQIVNFIQFFGRKLLAVCLKTRGGHHKIKVTWLMGLIWKEFSSPSAQKNNKTRASVSAVEASRTRCTL